MHGLIEIYGSRNRLHFLNHGTGKMLAMCLYFITEENAEMVNDYSCQKFTVACVWAMNQHILEASAQGFPFSSVAVSTPGRNPGWSDTPAFSLKHSEVLIDRTHRNYLTGDKPHGKQNLRIFGTPRERLLTKHFISPKGLSYCSFTYLLVALALETSFRFFGKCRTCPERSLFRE